MNRVRRVSSRPSRVQERLIGALIPDALGRRDESAATPLPVLPTLSHLECLNPAQLHVSTTRMDRSGRIHERILLRNLGWKPGTRLDMDTLHSMIVIATTSGGHHTVDDRGAIKLPASLRRLCRMEYGPPLVLAAAIPDQVMLVHPTAVIAHLLPTHYTSLIHPDQDRTEPAAADTDSP